VKRRLDLETLLPGDVLCFRLGGARSHHVGIYKGGPDRSFYHCPGPGKSFCVTSLLEMGDGLQSAYRLHPIENPTAPEAPHGRV
jgi:hypothetical protein